MKYVFYESRHGMGMNYFTLEEKHNFSYPLHMHRCYEIILMREGSMKVVIEEREYVLEQGDMILLKPNQVHSLDSFGKSHHLLCIFSPELVSSVSSKFIKYQMTSPIN